MNEIEAQGLTIINDYLQVQQNYVLEEDYDVLGVCIYIIDHTKKPDHKVYRIKPIAVYLNKELKMLAELDARTLFPNDGLLVAYSEDLGPAAPKQYEHRLYKFEKILTDKDSKFKVAKSIVKRNIYEVVMLDYDYKQYDEIRDQIEKIAVEKSLDINRTLYWLKDDWIIRPKTGGNKYDFNLPCDLWSYVPNGYEYNDRNGEIHYYCVGDLPKPESIYECYSIDTLIKRIWEQVKKTENNPIYTKEFVRKIIEAISSGQLSHISPEQLDRVRKYLNKMEGNLTGIPVIVEMILEKEEVKKYVENEKKKTLDLCEKEKKNILEKYESEKAGIKNQIDGLRRKMQETEHQQKEVCERNALSVKELEEALKAAYTKAVSEGSKLLSEVALLRTFISPEVVKNEQLLPIRYIKTMKASDQIDLLKQRLNNYMPKPTADKWSILLPFVIESGFVPLLSGMMSASIATDIACILSSTDEIGVIDIPVGLTSSYELNNAISSSNTDTIYIRNANMSPIEGYATDIGINAAKKMLGNKIDGFIKTIIASLTDESNYFKVPRAFMWLCCVLNTDDLIVLDEAPAETLYDIVQHRIDDDEEKYKGCQIWLRVINNVSEKIEHHPKKETLKQMVLKTIVDPFLKTYETDNDI